MDSKRIIFKIELLASILICFFIFSVFKWMRILTILSVEGGKLFMILLVQCWFLANWLLTEKEFNVITLCNHVSRFIVYDASVDPYWTFIFMFL